MEHPLGAAKFLHTFATFISILSCFSRLFFSFNTVSLFCSASWSLSDKKDILKSVDRLIADLNLTNLRVHFILSASLRVLHTRQQDGRTLFLRRADAVLKCTKRTFYAREISRAQCKTGFSDEVFFLDIPIQWTHFLLQSLISSTHTTLTPSHTPISLSLDLAGTHVDCISRTRCSFSCSISTSSSILLIWKEGKCH